MSGAVGRMQRLSADASASASAGARAGFGSGTGARASCWCRSGSGRKSLMGLGKYSLKWMGERHGCCYAKANNEHEQYNRQNKQKLEPLKTLHQCQNQNSGQ